MGSVEHDKHGLFERRNNAENIYIMTMNTGSAKNTHGIKYPVGDVEQAMKYVFHELHQNNINPSIIFIQESRASYMGHMHLDFGQLDGYGADYFYAHTANEAAVMWNNAEFLRISHIDEEWKKKINKINPNDYTYISTRFSGVLLIHRATGSKVLAVSWHGPHTGYVQMKKTRADFLNYLFELIEVLDPVYYNDIPILIGGDFNVSFDYSDLDRDFTFCDYILSKRRKTQIDYFVHSHGIIVKDCENIFDAIDIPFENIKSMIASLDHDPLIASVDLKPYRQYENPVKTYYNCKTYLLSLTNYHIIY